MGMSANPGVETPKLEYEIPQPSGRIEIEGRWMVAIPVEAWEKIVEELEDYNALMRAKKKLADPRSKFVSLEDARQGLFDNHIKKIRRRKKITQKELAGKLRVTQARVSQIEHPDYRPTMGVVKRVAKALGCEPEHLI